MKLATSAYPISWHTSWKSYADKVEAWVSEAAHGGAEVCVFPEYAAMEIASIGGEHIAADRAAALEFVASRLGELAQLHSDLAKKYQIYILSGSGPALLDGAYVNRCGFFAPNGDVAWQDKQIMTRFERDEWLVSSGGPLRVIETPLGRFGILICYDSEFPLLGRALCDVDVLLVPSCTEAQSGYWRVRIGAQARALEAQCVVAMSSLMSGDPRFYGVDEATGAGGVFCPPDKGYPATGVLALGELHQAGWVYADIDLSQIAEVRKDGHVLNKLHWSEQDPRSNSADKVTLG